MTNLTVRRRDALKLAVANAAVGALGSATSAASRPQPPGPQTQVLQLGGRPQFFLDGQPYAKPAFETYVPEEKFFRQFAVAGTDIFSFSTNLGPGFGAPVWLGPDQFSFEALDELAQRVLAAHPRGLLLPRIYLTPPDWWVQANLAECQMLSDGGQFYRQGIGHGRDGKAFPSLASPKWRSEAAAALQTVIRHMQHADYGSQLFGYMVTGLMSEEWYHWSIHSGQLSDYSVHASSAFRDWLRAKYVTTDALRRAWNDPHAEYEQIAAPSSAVREAGRDQRTFRDPSVAMPVIDWYLFYNDLVPDTMEVFLRAAKEQSDFKKVVGAFYCYMFEFGGDPEYGHNALGRLLRSPYLDFAIVTASYHDRALARGADYARAPITSVGLHGKLWYHDNDTVSYLYDRVNQANPDRATVERYRNELGVTATAQETIWQYRRGAGFVLGNGVYQSFFDLHGGYFDDPALMAEIEQLNELFAASARHDCTSVAQILVVSDEPSCSYATFESGFLQQTLQPAQVQLAKLGAPHDSILADDLALVDIERYKFVIFLNCFHLSDAQRALIRGHVLNRQRTVLWSYAPGLFNGATASVAGMSELTGFELAAGQADERVRLRLTLNEAGADLLGDDLPAGESIGHEHVWGQAFWVADPQAIALGRLEGRDLVALAMKHREDWTSIYSLNPVLPARCLRALARRAGVHIFNDRDDACYASRSYLCVNADGAGERTLRFPLPAKILDPFTGRLVRQSTEFSRSFVHKETLLLRYEI